MASGTINGTTSNQYIAARIVWSSTSDVAANQSTVSASLQLYKSQPSQYKTWGTGTWTISINGSPVTFSTAVELYDAKGWVTLGTHTVTVAHNSDGTKSVPISASGGIPSTTYTSTDVGATVALDTIPRASSMTVSGGTLGSAMTFTISAASNTFTHSLTYSFGGASGTILSYVAAGAHTWTPPITLANQIPNAVSGTVTFTLYTFAPGTQIGTKTYTAKLTVPSSVKPVVSAVTATEATSGLAAQFAAFVQSKSTLKVAVTASGIYGSTIKSYSVSFDGKTYSGNNCTTSPPARSGSLALSATVTDSRGRTAGKSVTVSILPYAPPAISGLTVWRCDAGGNADDSGDYVGITYAYTVAPVGNKNTVSAKIEYKRSTGSAWTELLTSSAYSVNTTVHPETELLSDYQWDLRLTVSDYFGSTAMTATLPSAEVLLDLLTSGDGLGIGKTSETANLLDIDWDTKVRGDLTVDGGLLYGGKTHHTFTPVEQGGGPGQGNNKINLGWGEYDGSYRILAAVDGTSMGPLAIGPNFSNMPSTTVYYQNANVKTSAGATASIALRIYKYGRIVFCSMYRTPVLFSEANTAYSDEGLIPSAYRPIQEVRTAAASAASGKTYGSVFATVQTDGTVWLMSERTAIQEAAWSACWISAT